MVKLQFTKADEIPEVLYFVAEEVTYIVYVVFHVGEESFPFEYYLVMDCRDNRLDDRESSSIL